MDVPNTADTAGTQGVGGRTFKLICQGNRTTLQEMLDHNFAKETIDGVVCPACNNALVVVDKTAVLESLPEVLLVQLIRFSYTDPEHTTKICTFVDFGDLSDFRFRLGDEVEHYELCAFINHTAMDGATGGHNTAEVMLDGTWALYDDDHVGTSTGIPTADAYVLCLRKKGCTASTARARGIENPAKLTCCVGSAFQFLNAIPGFYEALVDARQERLTSQGRAVFATLSQLRAAMPDAINLSPDLLATFPDMFNDFTVQNDSHEVVMHTLNNCFVGDGVAPVFDRLSFATHYRNQCCVAGHDWCSRAERHQVMTLAFPPVIESVEESDEWC